MHLFYTILYLLLCFKGLLALNITEPNETYIRHHPKIVFTFITNSKTLFTTHDGNETAQEQNATNNDFFNLFNPIQQFVQQFFANLMGEMRPVAIAKRENTTHSPMCNNVRCTMCMNRARAERKELDVERKQPRHYFLSISGGTDKRATAQRLHKREAVPFDDEDLNATTISGRDVFPTEPPATTNNTFPLEFLSKGYFFTVTLPTFLSMPQ